MVTDSGRVLSINVGGVRKFEYRGHPAQSAIWKSPVSGRIAARGVNLTGDRQADLEAHCGCVARRLHKLETEGENP